MFKSNKYPTKDKSFALFLRTREAEAVQELIKYIDSLPDKQKTAWINENSHMLYDAFEGFIESSSQALLDVSFEEESIQLSEQLIDALQDTSRKLDSILMIGEEEPKIKA